MEEVKGGKEETGRLRGRQLGNFWDGKKTGSISVFSLLSPPPTFNCFAHTRPTSLPRHHTWSECSWFCVHHYSVVHVLPFDRIGQAWVAKEEEERSTVVRSHLTYVGESDDGRAFHPSDRPDNNTSIHIDLLPVVANFRRRWMRRGSDSNEAFPCS